MELVQQRTANFVTIRTVQKDKHLNSYACESTLEVLYSGEVKQARTTRYEIYPLQGNESPVELRYDRAAVTSTLSASAKRAHTEKVRAKEQQAEAAARQRRDAMLASLPPDSPGVLEHAEQMVAAALQSNATIRVPSSGTEVIYSATGSRQPAGQGAPFFAGAYSDWNILCESQDGQLECITARRDENWVHCVPSISVRCEEASDGLIRTRLSTSELRSILPYLSVTDTLPDHQLFKIKRAGQHRRKQKQHNLIHGSISSEASRSGSTVSFFVADGSRVLVLSMKRANTSEGSLPRRSR